MALSLVSSAGVIPKACNLLNCASSLYEDHQDGNRLDTGCMTYSGDLVLDIAFTDFRREATVSRGDSTLEAARRWLFQNVDLSPIRAHSTAAVKTGLES
jgi:hypothetical protein